MRQVIVLDNLSTGHRYLVDDRAVFVQGDLGNRADFWKIPDSSRHAFCGEQFSRRIGGESAEVLSKQRCRYINVTRDDAKL